MGRGELAVTATRRGWDAARHLERDDLAGLMAMGRAITLNRVGARRRGAAVLHEALAEAQEVPGPTAQDSRGGRGARDAAPDGGAPRGP